nr:hypothetical protein [Natrialba swarupiae]
MLELLDGVGGEFAPRDVFGDAEQVVDVADRRVSTALLLEDGGTVAESGRIDRRRQSGGTAADDGDVVGGDRTIVHRRRIGLEGR